MYTGWNTIQLLKIMRNLYCTDMEEGLIYILHLGSELVKSWFILNICKYIYIQIEKNFKSGRLYTKPQNIFCLFILYFILFL